VRQGCQKSLQRASAPGVVDKNLRVAPARFDLFAETLYLIPLRDFTSQSENLCAVLRNFFSCRIKPVVIASGDYDAGFFPQEGCCERLAESAAPAGDQYNFVLQIAHAKRISYPEHKNAIA
jgi:hypothetical protein